jgi:hypothetical protein
MENLHLKNLQSEQLNQFKLKQNAEQFKNLTNEINELINNTNDILKTIQFKNNTIEKFIKEYFTDIQNDILTPKLYDLSLLTNLITTIKNWDIKTTLTKDELTNLRKNNGILFNDNIIKINYQVYQTEDEEAYNVLKIKLDAYNNITNINVIEM